MRVAGLVRRRDRYYFRLRVPADLVRRFGRREVKRSLATTDHACARRRAIRAAATLMTMFERLRMEPMTTEPVDAADEPGISPAAFDRFCREVFDKLTEDAPDVAQAFRDAAVRDFERQQQARAPRLPVDDDLIRLLARAYYGDLLSLDETLRMAADPSDAEARADRQAARAAQPQLIEHLGADGADGDLGWIEPAVRDAIDRYRLDIPIPDDGSTVSPLYARLCYAFMRAHLEANRCILERDRGCFGGAPRDEMFATEPAPQVWVVPAGPASGDKQDRTPTGSTRTPAAQPPPADAAAEIDPRSRQMPLQLLEQLLKERPMKPRTMEDYRVALRLFEESSGGKPVGSITRRDVVQFIADMRQMPKNARQRLKTDSLKQAIALNEAAQIETLAIQTVREKYVGFVKAFFAWAAESYVIEVDPAAGAKVPLPRGSKKAKRRDRFSRKQLKMIFAAPLYTGCESTRHVFAPGSVAIYDYRFWAPLVGLYSGARPNEIAQLSTEDLIQHRGQWFFNITTEDDPDEPDDTREHKTTNARRMIPLHPELVRIGILDYWRDMRAQGHRRLFPDWKPSKRGSYSDTLSKWFNGQFLKKHTIKTRRTAFYSFRHNFADALRATGMDSKSQSIIKGHASDGMDAVYGTDELFAQHIALFNRLEYEDLDLTHIRYPQSAAVPSRA